MCSWAGSNVYNCQLIDSEYCILVILTCPVLLDLEDEATCYRTVLVHSRLCGLAGCHTGTIDSVNVVRKTTVGELVK